MTYHHLGAEAETLPSAPQPLVTDLVSAEALLGIAWTEFLDANPDGLTSPAEHPDHALMTGEQFVQYASIALSIHSLRNATLVRALKRIAAPAYIPAHQLPSADQPNGWRDLAAERIDIARAELGITDIGEAPR